MGKGSLRLRTSALDFFLELPILSEHSAWRDTHIPTATGAKRKQVPLWICG